MHDYNTHQRMLEGEVAQLIETDVYDLSWSSYLVTMYLYLLFWNTKLVEMNLFKEALKTVEMDSGYETPILWKWYHLCTTKFYKNVGHLLMNYPLFHQFIV